MGTQPNEEAVEPVFDTWRRWGGAGSWTWIPRGPGVGDASALNTWSASTISSLLRSLRGTFRAVRVAIDGPPDAPLATAPASGLSIDEIERLIAGQPTTVQNLEFDLDLFAWFTVSGQTEARTAWFSGGATLSALVRSASPIFNLAIDHTLFCDGQIHGDSNRALHAANQPRLRAALATISEALGPVVEFEGLPGITATGFATGE